MIQLRQTRNTQLRQHPRLNKPLFDAITNKSLEELDRALKEGCDINARDYALSSNPLQSKSFLGPNNMNLGTPAIHQAIANNDPAMVNHMLRKPALDILAPTMEGITPLMLAARMGNDSIMQAILNHHGYAANQFQMLLAAQLPINARNLIGDTALHIAANAGHIGCFHALLRAGAFPMIKNKAGFTCLDLAKKKGYDGIVQLLSPNENVKEELEHIEYEEIRDAGGLVRLPEKDMKRLRDLHFSEEMINHIRSNLSRLSRGMISALIHGKIQLADAIIKAQDLEKKNFLNGLKNSILYDIEFFRKKHEEEKRKQEKDTKETNEDLPPLVDP
jgi:ankyrin repeat protein